MSAQPSPPYRIGNQEREQAVQALADHYSTGRLDGDEYSERVAQAWEARTVPDLQALFADLPFPRPDVLVPPGGRGRHSAASPQYGPPPRTGPSPYPGTSSYQGSSPYQGPSPYQGISPYQGPPPSGPAYGGPPNMQAPFGLDPVTGRPFSDKSKVVAGVLQIFLPFGIGRFYSGHAGIGVAQLLVTLFTFGFGAIWSFIDGIVLLAGRPTDPQGRPMRT